MDFLTQDNVSILKVIDGQNHRKAYVNSIGGRAELIAENDQDIVNQVFAVWGDSPTVFPIDRSKKGLNEITEIQIALVELASMIV